MQDRNLIRENSMRDIAPFTQKWYPDPECTDDLTENTYISGDFLTTRYCNLPGISYTNHNTPFHPVAGDVEKLIKLINEIHWRPLLLNNSPSSARKLYIKLSSLFYTLGINCNTKTEVFDSYLAATASSIMAN